MPASQNAAPLLGLATFASLLLGVTPAGAQQQAPDPFTIVIDNPSQVIRQGQTAYFTGTITNISGVAQPNNGYAVNYQVGYYSNTLGSLPAQLAPALLSKTAYAAGDSYHGLLFTTTASATATPGVYTGPGFNFDSYVYLPGTFQSSADSPTYYTITVAAPEPSQYAALGLGVVGLCALALRARKKPSAARPEAA